MSFALLPRAPDARGTQTGGKGAETKPRSPAKGGEARRRMQLPPLVLPHSLSLPLLPPLLSLSLPLSFISVSPSFSFPSLLFSLSPPLSPPLHLSLLSLSSLSPQPPLPRPHLPHPSSPSHCPQPSLLPPRCLSDWSTKPSRPRLSRAPLASGMMQPSSCPRPLAPSSLVDSLDLLFTSPVWQMALSRLRLPSLHPCAPMTTM